MTSDALRAEWDAEATVFDDEAHHALLEPRMRAAWWDVLAAVLPPAPATVADLGCGTGTIAVLLAEHGYDVLGIDVSPEMIARARAKAERHGVTARFAVGDAAAPESPQVDVVLTRHVAWAVPDLDAALASWVRLLEPDGRLVLIEGLWSNGAGLGSAELASAVGRVLPMVTVRGLPDPALWGYELTDSRYVVVARTVGAGGPLAGQ